AVDRRPARRRHPSRTAAAARMPHGRHAPWRHCMSPITDVDEALKRIRRGEMVLVVDDEDRENAGDLTIAACWVSGEQIHLLLLWARGLVGMPCDAARLDELAMGPMISAEVAGNDPAFTVSIDHVTAGSGIGASDRATTIRQVLDP